MKNQDLKVGDKVMLSPDTTWYVNDMGNPLNTEGAVIDKCGGWVTVHWSNDSKNSYRADDSDLISCNNLVKEPSMKNPKITKDCFVNVEGWTHEEILKAAEVFVENIEGAYIGEDFWLSNKQNGYDYLLKLEDGLMFVGNSKDLERHDACVELTKEDLFITPLAKLSTIRAALNPDNLESFEWFMDTLENNMHKESTTKDLIDSIAQAYEVLCNSEDALQKLQQEVVKNRKDYEDAVEELQKSVKDKGFKVEPIESASSKPTKNFDRYSYWDVSEWTAEEVQEAAEILAKEFGAEIHNVDTLEGYHNLYIDEDNDVMVNSGWRLEHAEKRLGKEFTQRTKQDIL